MKLMEIEKVFRVKAGTVVGGTTAATIRDGQRVTIQGNGKSYRDVIASIHHFKDELPEVGEGMTVGLLFTHLPTDEIHKGFLVLQDD